jgi:hypothetical protein
MALAEVNPLDSAEQKRAVEDHPVEALPGTLTRK